MFYARKVANEQQIDYNIKMETYQRGRTEPHSKCGCREIGTWVRIPPSPPSEQSLKIVKYLIGLSKKVTKLSWLFSILFHCNTLVQIDLEFYF